MFGCCSIARVTSAAKASRSTASAEPGGHAVLVGGAHDQRAERAHFLVEQADGIMLGIVGAEAVRADHLGERGRSRAPASCRRRRAFRSGDVQARLGELPGRFAPASPPPMMWMSKDMVAGLVERPNAEAIQSPRP